MTNISKKRDLQNNAIYTSVTCSIWLDSRVTRETPRCKAQLIFIINICHTVYAVTVRVTVHSCTLAVSQHRLPTPPTGSTPRESTLTNSSFNSTFCCNCSCTPGQLRSIDPKLTRTAGHVCITRTYRHGCLPVSTSKSINAKEIEPLVVWSGSAAMGAVIC